MNRAKDDLSRARPIVFDVVPTDRVSVGARVTVRDEQGQERRMSFLGPWDTDPHRGVFYYRAPLPMALMGHRVGETVAIETANGQTAAYDILAIARANEPKTQEP